MKKPDIPYHKVAGNSKIKTMYQAGIGFKGKRIYIGLYRCHKEAMAYNGKLFEMYGKNTVFKVID